MGVTGGSGGGVLTNWTITQTDRFKAAVSQRSISDWSNWWYTADFTQFQPSWFQGAPFEVPAEFAARSAITFVAKVKTPLMLVEGESRPAHAVRRGRRADVPRPQVPEGADRDGALPGRDPRPLAQRARPGTASSACATSWAGSTST